MKQYRVDFFYLAQGMGQPETRDYGIIEAQSVDEAKELVATRASKSPSEYMFMLGCLRATEVVKDGMLVEPYKPSPERQAMLEALAIRAWAPQWVHAIINVRNCLNEEIKEKYEFHVPHSDDTIDCLIAAIDTCLEAHWHSAEATPLRLLWGQWKMETDEDDSTFVEDGFMILPHTDDSIRAAALIMGLTEADVRYGLEEEGEVSTGTHLLEYYTNNPVEG